MSVKKVSGIPEVDGIISQLNKHFKKENLITLGPSKEPIQAIPTGSLKLDIATGIGGMPMGRVIEIYGPEASGKTSLALRIAAEYQKNKDRLGHQDRQILVIDLEHTITYDLMVSLGLEPEKILFSKPDTAEQAFQIILDLVASGTIGLIIFDSIDAAQSEQQLKRKVGETHMGGISKILSEVLRQLSKDLENSDTTAIFINQIRMNPGQMMGSPIVTPGGKALPFYCSMRIRTLPHKESPTTPTAMLMRLKIVKNKFRPPRKDNIEFDFIYGCGPDPSLDLISAAKELGIAYFGGPNLMIKLPGEDKGTKLAGGGTTGAAAHLDANPKDFVYLHGLCMQIGGIVEPDTVVNTEHTTTSIE